MKKPSKNAIAILVATILSVGCNSGTSPSSANTTPDWQNEVTISHSSSFPYSLQGVNSYWLTISNQTANDFLSLMDFA